MIGGLSSDGGRKVDPHFVCAWLDRAMDLVIDRDSCQIFNGGTPSESFSASMIGSK